MGRWLLVWILEERSGLEVNIWELSEHRDSTKSTREGVWVAKKERFRSRTWATSTLREVIWDTEKKQLLK